MDQSRLDELIEKYAAGRITPEEWEELMEWYRAAEVGAVEWPSDEPDEREQLQQRMLSRLQAEIRRVPAEVGATPAEIRRVPVEVGAAPAEIRRVPAEVGAVPAEIRRVPAEVGAAPVGIRRVPRIRAWQVAASLIILFSSLWIARQYLDLTGRPAFITTSNPSGKIQAILLPDSSRVWLNAASSIRYSSAFGKGSNGLREVFVDGECFFDVVTDPAHSFVVHSRSLTTTVLGTSFDVKSFADESITSVTVIRGKVGVRDSARTIGVRDSGRTIGVRDSGQAMGAGDHASEFAILTPARQLQVDTRTGKSTMVAIDTTQVIGWRNGKLQFSGQPLEEVVASLGRWYNVRFIFANPAIGSCRYYLNFDNTIPLQQMLVALKEATDLDFREDDARHTVTISGTACQ